MYNRLSINANAAVRSRVWSVFIQQTTRSRLLRSQHIKGISGSPCNISSTLLQCYCNRYSSCRLRQLCILFPFIRNQLLKCNLCLKSKVNIGKIIFLGRNIFAKLALVTYTGNASIDFSFLTNCDHLFWSKLSRLWEQLRIPSFDTKIIYSSILNIFDYFYPMNICTTQ